jgi:hypothetical protein
VRHIEIHTFKPSEEWRQSAKNATEELLAKATADERADYIKKHSDIWKALGKELIAHFGHKCWYTDASDYGARLDVEHFRPKAKTVELTEEEFMEAGDNLLLKLPDPKRGGYWWLAFDLENLLLCAQVMNREEKRNFFPLHKDSPVASETNKAAWRSEIPVFLDPRKLDDVCLVAYDETGGMRPRSGLTQWEHLRVVITNECFGLSRFQPLTEGRQRIWQTCSGLIERYVNAATKQSQEGTPSPVLQQEKDDALLDLKKMLDPEEPFATVAASCLYNSPYEWARVLATQPQHRYPRIQPPVPNIENSCQI